MINTRIIIITVIYLAILTAGAVFGIKPFVTQVNSSITNLRDKNVEYLQSTEKLNDLVKLNLSQSDITNAQTKVEVALPATPEYDQMLLTVEQLASNHQLTAVDINVNVATTTASKATTSANYKELSGSATVKGSYANIKSFMSDLENLDRIVAITSVAVTPEEDDGGALSLGIKFNYYYQKSN